jgi:hypothetical protein
MLTHRRTLKDSFWFYINMRVKGQQRKRKKVGKPIEGTRVRERKEREHERQTEKERARETEKERARETEKERVRETEKERVRETEKESTREKQRKRG